MQNKENNYHIKIKNLETKKSANFLVMSDKDNPMKIQGSDNLAPKYQVGKTEYGDFTNHAVWAQGDWSEGGGKKYWDAYRDGYNVYPFTKKYFSKSGIRAIDYPGELRLGSNAELVRNFPENSGTIVKIKRYSTSIVVGVNRSDSFAIYRTYDGGANWIKMFDSEEYGYFTVYSGQTMNNFSNLVDISIGRAPGADVRLRQRTNPDTGVFIPADEWDPWAGERRESPNSTWLYFIANIPNSQMSYLFKIPFDNAFFYDNEHFGYGRIDLNNQVEITEVIRGSETSYPATFVNDLMNRKLGVDPSIIDNFYVGQRIDVYYNGAYSSTTTIVGRTGDQLIVDNKINDVPPITIKISNQKTVLRLSENFQNNFWAVVKDRQGNSYPGDHFNYNLKNVTKNDNARFLTICSEKGVSHRNIIQRVYTGTDHIGDTRKYPSGSSSDYYYYLYYTPPSEGVPESRNGYWMSADERNYVVVEGDKAYEAGDMLAAEKLIAVEYVHGSENVVGNYLRKNTSERNADFYYSRDVINTNVFRVKSPNDIYPSYSLSNEIWFSAPGIAVAHYFDESNRELVLGTRNANLIQSYVYQIDDASTGTLSNLFQVGELSIGALVRINEKIFAGTNDKGRVYVWNGMSYEILQRFDLDPSTNKTFIMAAETFQNKLIITDNYNGNVMSYDPEEDAWDDICSPEYTKTSNDLITAFGIIGGSLFIGTNKANNLLWSFNENNLSSTGNLVSSWYDAEMPAVDKKGLYAQILAHEFIKSGAKIRLAIQFDYKDTWYYLSKERNIGLVTEPTELQELDYRDFKSSRAFYLFFPYNTPKFKIIRYRIELVGGQYRDKQQTLQIFRPVINNIDIFYILTDPKEIIFPYTFSLEERQQTLGGPGSNDIRTHREKLEFLMDIWNNDTIVEITHIDGVKHTCIPFKPVQLTGGGMSVFYNNINPSRRDLDKLSYIVSMMFKNINKIDQYA